MKVTALKVQTKNPERVSVFVDNSYSFSLTMNEILEYKLKKDYELSATDLSAYKKLSEDGKLRASTLEWLMGRPHSTKELREYLYKKKTDKDLQEKLVAEFTQKGVVNDERFAEWYAERLLRKNKSTRAITNELRSKGIDAVTIQSIVNREESGDDEALQNLIKKLQHRSRYADQKKLIAHLQSKGFSYSDIKSALTIIEPEQEP